MYLGLQLRTDGPMDGHAARGSYTGMSLYGHANNIYGTVTYYDS
jgi:hypothetical protein